MRHLIRHAVVILCFLLVPLETLLACSCASTPSIEDNWDEADQVFIGNVIGIDSSNVFFSYSGRSVTMFNIQIQESFKDSVYSLYTMRTFMGMVGGSCDSYFEMGRSYLIYANGDFNEGFLKSSICGRTKSIEEVDKKELEKLKQLYNNFKKEKAAGNSYYRMDQESYERRLLKATNSELREKIKTLTIATIALASILVVLILLIWTRKRKTNA